MLENTENLGKSQAGFHQTVDIMSVKHHPVYGIPLFTVWTSGFGEKVKPCFGIKS